MEIISSIIFEEEAVHVAMHNFIMMIQVEFVEKIMVSLLQYVIKLLAVKVSSAPFRFPNVSIHSSMYPICQCTHGTLKSDETSPFCHDNSNHNIENPIGSSQNIIPILNRKPSNQREQKRNPVFCRNRFADQFSNQLTSYQNPLSTHLFRFIY